MCLFMCSVVTHSRLCKSAQRGNVLGGRTLVGVADTAFIACRAKIPEPLLCMCVFCVLPFKRDHPMDSIRPSVFTPLGQFSHLLTLSGCSLCIYTTESNCIAAWLFWALHQLRLFIDLWDYSCCDSKTGVTVQTWQLAAVFTEEK